MDDPGLGSVTPIVRPMRSVQESVPGVRADLEDLSAEHAATILMDEFVRTGYAEAWVAEPERVRSLMRRDCRRRGLPMRSLQAKHVVAVVDEARRNEWLLTPEGLEHEQRSQTTAADVMERLLSSFLFAPSHVPGPRGS